MRLVSVTIAAALAALVATAAAGAAPQSEAASGKALFQSQGCMQCHGTVGQGNRSAGLKLAPNPIPYAAFVAQLRKPRSEMPPYSATLVSDADAAKIYAYLTTIGAGKSAGNIAMLAGVGHGNAGVLADDGTAAGRAVFAQNCAACHGASGAGGGIGPALVGERTKKDLAATVAFIKKPTAKMPALYPGTLDERSVAAVAAYVQSL